jgi:hypothetical protein
MNLVEIDCSNFTTKKTIKLLGIIPKRERKMQTFILNLPVFLCICTILTYFLIYVDVFFQSCKTLKSSLPLTKWNGILSMYYAVVKKLKLTINSMSIDHRCLTKLKDLSAIGVWFAGTPIF